MDQDEKRALVEAVARIVTAYTDQRITQARNEVDVELASVHNEIERILTHVAEVRTTVDEALSAVMTQVFNDAYTDEVMGHYRRFLVAECARVGIGVGEYAKVMRAVEKAENDGD